MLETIKNLNVVIIRIKKEKYLLEVENVKEIYIPGEKIIPIPLSDKTIVGIIDIRGEIYSILSLRRIIYFDEVEHYIDKQSRILLLAIFNLKIAILVDEVLGVREVPLSIFKAKSSIVETDLNYKFIKSIGVLDDETYILLDLEAFIESLDINIEETTMSLPNIRTKVPALLTIKPEVPEKEIVSKIPKFTMQKPKATTPRKYNVKSKIYESEDLFSLTPEQEDMLREVGNIGTGNAVTALSRLIKKNIDMSLTNVGIISFDKLSEQFGGPSEKVCGIFSQIKNSQSTIFQAFELRPLMNLIVSLAGKNTKIKPDSVNSKDDLDDFAISTVTEMGNILAGHYASALADLAGTKMMIEIPEFSMMEVGALGNFLSKELKSISNFVIIIKTSIKVIDLKLNIMFFFIPDLETLYNLFEKLNIKYEPIEKRELSSVTREINVKTPKIIDLSKLVLSEIQKDALQEIGNIGAGNSANALAQMINKKVTINVPTIEMVELEKYAKIISKKNEKLFVSWSNVSGKTRATILSIFKVRDVLKLLDLLIDEGDRKKITEASVKSIDNFPDLYKDAIGETGHILASHYASALGDLLEIRLMTEPPDMSIDTGPQLFNSLSNEIGLLKKLSLTITTNIIISDHKIIGTFLFIPNVETLHELLNALERFYE